MVPEAIHIVTVVVHVVTVVVHVVTVAVHVVTVAVLCYSGGQSTEVTDSQQQTASSHHPHGRPHQGPEGTTGVSVGV